ncbi:MAG: hypothetical protein NZM31_01795 [Gemmatales bacterium]|nr:hypothetical protein [Gemmatales bacterium]MDW8385729.1 hypothetical protein [Gemmatales bacterium]
MSSSGEFFTNPAEAANNAASPETSDGQPLPQEQALNFGPPAESPVQGASDSQTFAFSATPQAVEAPSPTPESQSAPWNEPPPSPVAVSQPDTATADTQTIANASTAVGSRSAARPRPRIPMAFWLIAVLLPSALILVPVALYIAFQRLTERREPVIHPLESIQDDGLYKDYQEGKRQEVISPLAELPKDRPPVKLGETVQVGGLEVTPLEVVRQKVPFSFYRGARGYESYDEVLVLRVRVKNISDIVFHPHDPVFNRAYKQGVQPYSYLTIGEKRFYGIVADPTTERVRGQNFGELLPEEEMETIFIAAQDTSNGRVVDELKKLPPSEKLIWRIQLRKGRENVRGRYVWATTVIPVEFRVEEIKQQRGNNTPRSPT